MTRMARLTRPTVVHVIAPGSAIGTKRAGDTGRVPVSGDVTLLPNRTGQRLERWRRRLVQDLAQTHVVGLLVLVLGVSIAAVSLLPDALAPGLGPIAALTTSIGVTILLGLWLTFYPQYSALPSRWATALAPLIWIILWLALRDPQHMLSPMPLIYSGALCAATCGPRLVALNTILCLVSLWLWVADASDADEFVLMRFLGNGATLLAVPVVVYLVRRRATLLREQVRRSSVSDALTGLPNRRHLEVVAPRLLAQALQQEREIFALTIDTDRMASVNERHGHLAGDELIKQVAGLLRRALRPEDVLVRTTGAQFVALGLSRNEWEAMRVGERVRQAMRKQTMRVPVTCSIGVASARVMPGLDPGEWIWNLTSVAEESLAAAKASGRDRVTGARQSGVVLGDALELVTSPQSDDPLPLRAGRGRPFIPTIDVAAYLLAAVLVLGVALMLWFMVVGRQQGFGQIRLWLQGSLTIVMGGLAGILMVSPATLRRVSIATVFVGDGLWALGGSDTTPDGFTSPLYAVLMAGVAAFLFTPRLLLLQMLLTYPLMWIQLYHPGESIGATAWSTLGEGTLLNIATAILYFVRLESSDLVARSRSLSTIDQLTGVPDRRYLIQQAPAIVAGALRLGVPVSVTVIDIDHFGEVNDRLGHSAGDEALIEVTRSLLRVARAEDIVCRHGGDDLVIVGNHDLADGLTMAERSRDAVAQVWLEDDPLSASVGVVSAVPIPGVDPVQWLMQRVEEAREAMGQAKATGGGRVVAAGLAPVP